MPDDPQTDEQLPVGEGQNGTAPDDANVDGQVAPTGTPPPPGSGQMPTNGRPPVPAPQGQPSQDQIAQAKTNRDQQLDFHPAVTAAHVARKVGEAIAGGPRTKTTIDPNTGVVTREKEPLSTKDIITGALANILGGISQAGNGFVAAREHRAAPPPQPLPTQQAQQQQDQQATEDFNRVQQQKVRQAKVIEANLNAMRTGYSIGKEDDEAKDSVIQNHASDLEQWQKSGAVEAQNIPSDQLLKKGYDTSKYIAVPDGRVPVINADGKRVTNNGVPLSQLTYAVVDGTTQTPLTQDKYDQFAKYGLMQAKDGFKLPEGATITGASLSMMNHKLDLINQTQRELDEVHEAVGGDKVDLAEQIRKNPQMLSAIQAFHNDAASTEPDGQVANLQAKNPQAAGLMRELFGNQNLEKFKEDRLARTKAEATKQETTAKAEATAATPLGQAALQEKQLQVQKLQKDIADKGGIDFSKIVTNPLDEVKNPDGTTAGARFSPDENYPVNADVLQGLAQQDPGLAASVKAIGEGRELLTPQAQRTKDGQAIMKAVNLAYPRYNAAKVDSYFKGRQTGTSGTLGSKTNSFATALDHLGNYMENINNISASPIPGVSTVASWLGNKSAKDLSVARTALAAEIASAYAQGAGTEHDREKWEKDLGGGTPEEVRNGARATAELLHGKFAEYQNQYRNMVPGGLHDDNLQLMSDKAAQAYQKVTGKKVGGVQPFNQGQQQPQGGAPKPAPNKQAILQSITLPGGGHPADVKWMPDGTQIFHSGKPSDPWTTVSGTPVK